MGFVVTVTVGVFLEIVSVIDATDELLFKSPLYVAVIESAPIGREDVVYVAVVPLMLTVPSTVEPLAKVTVPVTEVDRVSVNFTEVPGVAGFTEEVSVDVGLASEIVSVVVAVAEL